jgi:hypothetical protein
MTEQVDGAYRARRPEDQRRMAEEAADAPQIATLHWELAARHEELANPGADAAPHLRTG